MYFLKGNSGLILMDAGSFSPYDEQGMRFRGMNNGIGQKGKCALLHPAVCSS